MINVKYSFFLIGSILTLLMTSCENNVFYESYVEVPDTKWDRSQKPFFEFEISDTSLIYDIVIQFRNDNKYPYQNIYFFSHLIGPQNKVLNDTISCNLANERGQWIGKSVGNIWNTSFMYGKATKFIQPGKYTLELEQALRDEVPVEGITDIGLKLLAYDPNKK